jgi:DegV family protein with EDD domain
MVKIAWVTDSTAFLNNELRNHPDLYQIPMTIIMDGREYTDGVDLTPEELYTKLKSLETPAKTSQPSIGAFRELYENLQKDYDCIIAVLVSAKLSGTVSSSEQAAQMVDIPVYSLDSKILSYPLTRLILKGMELAESGLDTKDIISELKALRDTGETYVLIGSLEQLHRSGRMSGVQFFLGSMLNVKPIISVQDGELSVREKARSERKAKDKIVKLLRSAHERKPLKEVFILYGLHPEEAEIWKKELEEEFAGIKFGCYSLGATIGVHAGEHTLGISWLNGLE